VNTRARIFLVDDYPMIRERMAEVISRETDLEFCGEAEDAPHALQRIANCRPHLVTVELNLKGSSGWSLVKDVTKPPSRGPRPPTAALGCRVME
jgi:DNA-binding NarL/FixJ family response regulator